VVGQRSIKINRANLKRLFPNQESSVVTEQMAVFSISVETSDAVTATASHTEIKFTRVQVGQGRLHDSQNPQSLKECVVPVMEADLISDNIVTPSANILFQIDSAKIKSAFTLSEYGIFATCAAVNGGKEFLFAYASAWNNTNDGQNMGDGLAPSSSSSPFSNQYIHQINYSTTQKITSDLHVTPSVKQHAQEHIAFKDKLPPIDPLGLPSTTKQGILDFIPDATNTYLWAANSGLPVWIRSFLPLSQSSTVYIRPNGDDKTGELNNPARPFATIQKAHDFLLNYYFLPNVAVLISVAEGVYVSKSTITLNHPQGSQISLVGAKPVSSSIKSIHGSSENPKFTVTSAEGFSVGQYVISDSPLGITSSAPVEFRGAYQIKSISGNELTCWAPVHNASIRDVNLTDPATLRRYPSILQHTGEDEAIINSSIGCIANLTISGPGSSTKTNGLYHGCDTLNVNLCVTNFYIAINGSHTIKIANLACGFCDTGLMTSGETIHLPSHQSPYFDPGNIIFNANSLRGIWIGLAKGSLGTITKGGKNCYCITVGNGETGILSDSLSTVSVYNTISNNNRFGGASTYKSLLRPWAGVNDVKTDGNYFLNNTEYDLWTHDQGSIMGILGGGKCEKYNPPNNTLSSDQSWISVYP
jgi:hypothetical protein